MWVASYNRIFLHVYMVSFNTEVKLVKQDEFYIQLVAIGFDKLQELIEGVILFIIYSSLFYGTNL